MKVLVTGAAGFIGYHVARRLAETKKCEVLGVDTVNDYYDPALKRARLAELAKVAERVEVRGAGASKAAALLGGGAGDDESAGDGEGATGTGGGGGGRARSFETFRFLQADFADAEKFPALVAHFRPDYVVHLGAQPGVRFSMENPAAYTRNNLDGFATVLEACRRTPPKHLVFASSSSVYGAGAKAPFREDDNTDQPISYYGATKKANELMAHSYVLNHRVRATGLRFFTVYGPWGRPDMAPTLFARAICEGRPLKLFNHGKNLRDFTYIDDIVDGVVKVLLYPPPQPAVAGGGSNEGPRDQGTAPALRVFNLGHHRPVETLLFVRMMEELLGKKAEVELLPPQPGDMFETCADLTRVQAAIAFAPKVALEAGLRRFVAWFRDYYRL
jgi:UDP-glucuronate 4-epimerase